MGFKKDDLEIDTTALKNAINETLPDADSQDLANTFNGLAQMGFKKSDLGISKTALGNAINKNLRKAEPQHLANTFNGLAQMGFKKDDLEIDTTALKNAINETLPDADSQDLANIFNGLINLGFVDKDFLSRIVNIGNFIEKLDISQFSPETTSSLARFDFYCCEVLEEKKVFSGELRRNLQKIYKGFPKEKAKNNTELEERVRAGFKEIEGTSHLKTESAKPIDWEGIPVLRPDITFYYEDYKFCIEVDGPTHFNKDASNEYVLNGKTTIRNELYQGHLKNSGKKLIFVSLPFFEIDKINEEKLTGYLEEKLTQAIEEKQISAVEKVTSSQPEEAKLSKKRSFDQLDLGSEVQNPSAKKLATKNQNQER